MGAQQPDFRSVLAEEGDAYFERNDHTANGPDDAVLAALRDVHRVASVSNLLEIGCMDGRRLAIASGEFSCNAVGVEASPVAVTAARRRFPSISVRQGVVPDALEGWLAPGSFDTIVAGFFLYLLPREFLFRTVAAIDGLLSEGGHLLVSDFMSPFPVRREYEHDDRLATFKMNYSALWLGNPQYELSSRRSRWHDPGRTAGARASDDFIVVDTLVKRHPSESYASG